MSDKLNLMQKLVEIRKTVPYLKKDTKGYEYSYASGTLVISSLRGKMDELGVLLTIQATNKNVTETKFKTVKKGLTVDAFSYLVEMDLLFTWINADNPDEILEQKFATFGKQNDPSKACGSAYTYGERYYLLKFFNIPTDNDDPDRFQKKQENKSNGSGQSNGQGNGSNQNKSQDGSKQNNGNSIKPTTITMSQVKLLRLLLGKYGTLKGQTESEVEVSYKKKYKLDSLRDIAANKFQAYLKVIINTSVKLVAGTDEKAAHLENELQEYFKVPYQDLNKSMSVKVLDFLIDNYKNKGE